MEDRNPTHQTSSAMKSKITPCLWFDNEGEEAANYYIAIFPNSKITAIAYYPDTGKEQHGKDAGSVLMVSFELDGRPFTTLNAGTTSTFSEAISLQVECETQEEIDYYWEKLTVGGDPDAQVCGWVKDKYGVSWQIFPSVMLKFLMDPDRAKAQRAMAAMMQMKKLDIAKLKAAFAGGE
jgi:predicted 3-demethylubiquinone-9 3-methyltransferase (glyoxalase superfamily)